jgi:hypothetical protein
MVDHGGRLRDKEMTSKEQTLLSLKGSRIVDCVQSQLLDPSGRCCQKDSFENSNGDFVFLKRLVRLD